jgi:hypothetical protein
MSNKKLATAKKAQQKLMKEKRDLQPTHIGQLMQLFEDREYIMTPPPITLSLFYYMINYT